MKKIENVEKRLSNYLKMPVWIYKKSGVYVVQSVASGDNIKGLEFRVLKDIDDLIIFDYLYKNKAC